MSQHLVEGDTVTRAVSNLLVAAIHVALLSMQQPVDSWPHQEYTNMYALFYVVNCDFVPHIYL